MREVKLLFGLLVLGDDLAGLPICKILLLIMTAGTSLGYHVKVLLWLLVHLWLSYNDLWIVEQPIDSVRVVLIVFITVQVVVFSDICGCKRLLLAIFERCKHRLRLGS